MNDAPSFSGSSKLDKQIKTDMIGAVLDILDMTVQKKIKFKRVQRKEWKQRLWNPQPKRKSNAPTILPALVQRSESDRERQEAEEVNDVEEWLENCNVFDQCYPIETNALLMERYDQILQKMAGNKSNVG